MDNNRATLPATLVVGDAEIQLELEVTYTSFAAGETAIELVTVNGTELELDQEAYETLADQIDGLTYG